MKDLLKSLNIEILNLEFQLKKQRARRNAKMEIYHAHGVCGIPRYKPIRAIERWAARNAKDSTEYEKLKKMVEERVIP